MDSHLSSVRIIERNRPLGNNKNTPLALSGQQYHSSHRRYTTADNIIDIAIEKFKKNQQGITFEDLRKRGLALHKRQAQETLKYYRRKGILFTLELHRPQEYFASTIRSEVIKIKSPINPTGVTHYFPHHPNCRSPLSNYLDDIAIESLEGYVLPLLKAAPKYIHNLHFKTKIAPECYAEHDIQELPHVLRNKGKKLFEIIGNAGVTYTFYPSGTVNIEVKCSNNPFQLETEVDRRCLIHYPE